MLQKICGHFQSHCQSGHEQLSHEAMINVDDSVEISHPRHCSSQTGKKRFPMYNTSVTAWTSSSMNDDDDGEVKR